MIFVLKMQNFPISTIIEISVDFWLFVMSNEGNFAHLEGGRTRNRQVNVDRCTVKTYLAYRPRCLLFIFAQEPLNLLFSSGVMYLASSSILNPPRLSRYLHSYTWYLSPRGHD